MTFFLELLFVGLALGAIYSIIALGFVLVYKSTGVLNFAQGELVVLGSYLSIALIGNEGLPVLVGVAIVVVIMALLGAALYLTVFKWMVGQPFFSLVLVTIGIAVVIQGAILIAAGSNNQTRLMALPGGQAHILGAHVPWSNLVTIGCVGLIVAAVFVFFRRTTLGLQMRAVGDNLAAADTIGLDTQRVYLATWMLAVALAGLAGFFFANFSATINVSGSSSIGLRAFPAALLGGLSAVGGAPVGGMSIGIAEQITSGYLGSQWRDVVPFLLLLIFIIVRPYGLFGHSDRSRV